MARSCYYYPIKPLRCPTLPQTLCQLGVGPALPRGRRMWHRIPRACASADQRIRRHARLTNGVACMRICVTDGGMQGVTASSDVLLAPTR